MRHAPLALLALLLSFAAWTPTTAADEAADASTRYHEAYVLEVIEGDIQCAGKGYLALMEDEGTPAAIRAESRFRFAICAALLGRADEARLRLTTLIEDGAVSETLRSKAQTYLASLANVEAGSELERQLQKLVFDLGRVGSDGAVPAYRDFEIIGDASIPFVEKLLQHRDPLLRRHAFRLLCRMEHPGMGEHWRPEIGFRGGLGSNFVHYLRTRPDQQAVLERRLLSLGDEELSWVLAPIQASPQFSIDFVCQVIEREGCRAEGLGLVWTVAIPPDLNPHIARWLQGEDESLRDDIAARILAGNGPMPNPFPEDLYRILVDHLVRHGGQPQDPFQDLTDAQPTAVLLDGLEALVRRGTKAPAEGEAPTFRLITHGAVPIFAHSLEKRPPENVDWSRYKDILKRWADVYPTAYAAFQKPSYKPPYPARSYVNRLWVVLGRLPDDEGDALGRWILDTAREQTGTAIGDRAERYVEALRPDDPARLARLVRLLRFTADEADRATLIGLLPLRGDASSPELKRAFVKALPSVLPYLDDDQVGQVIVALPSRVDELGREDAWAAVHGFVETLRHRPEATRRSAILTWTEFRTMDPTTERAAFVVGPLLDALRGLWDAFVDEDRAYAIERLWSATYIDDIQQHGMRKSLFPFLRDHLGEPGTDWIQVSRHPDDFPLADWIRRVPLEELRKLLVGPRRRVVAFDPVLVDAYGRSLLEDLEKVDAQSLTLVHVAGSTAVSGALFDRVLSAGSPSQRSLALGMLGRTKGGPATLDGLGTALEVLLAEDEPDLDELNLVAQILARERPTKRLVDAALLLLEDRADRDHLLGGIQIAESLAQPEFVPALEAIYVETLDSRVRKAARKALDTIEHLATVRENR